MEKRLHRGVSFDYKTREYVVTDEYVSGFEVLACFKTEKEARKFLKELKQ